MSTTTIAILIWQQTSKSLRAGYCLALTITDICQARQLDIPGNNADDGFELPIPTTYIINTDSFIRYAFVDMDYTKRHY